MTRSNYIAMHWMCKVHARLLIRIMLSTQSLIDHIIVFDKNSVFNVNISDHDLICFFFTFLTMTYRNYQWFHWKLILSDLEKANLDRIYYIADIDIKFNILNSNTLIHLFDFHIPVISKLISNPTPWLTVSVIFLISLRDKNKIKFRKSRLPIMAVRN